MKNVRVIQKFKDTKTGEIRPAGTVFEATQERILQLLAFESEHKTKLIEILEETESKPEPSAEKRKKGKSKS